MKQTMIVAYFGNRTLGWSMAKGKAIFYGNKEWEMDARSAAHRQEFVSLYEGALEGVAEIDNPDNLKGVFLALACLPRERIRISTCPEGMLQELDLVFEEDHGTDPAPIAIPKFSRNDFLRKITSSL